MVRQEARSCAQSEKMDLFWGKEDVKVGLTLSYKLSNLPILKATQKLGQGAGAALLSRHGLIRLLIDAAGGIPANEQLF